MKYKIGALLVDLTKACLKNLRFLFPAFGGLLFGYDIGATSSATISIQVNHSTLLLVLLQYFHLVV